MAHRRRMRAVLQHGHAGSSLPSMNSSDAPPLSRCASSCRRVLPARPGKRVAAPTTTVAAGWRDPRGSEPAPCPNAKVGISEDAKRAVPEDGTGRLESLLHRLGCWPCQRQRFQEAGTFIGRQRLVTRCPGDLLATTTSIGRTILYRASRRGHDRPGVLDPVGLGQALADRLPWASRKVLAIPPPSPSRRPCRRDCADLDLARDLAPPMIAAKGRSGSPSACRELDLPSP